MTLMKLASLIARREGKKHQASIGDIREILKVIIDLQIELEQSGCVGPIDTLAGSYAMRVAKLYAKARRKK